MNDIKILCLIPARSGSKGIPHKNIRNFKGKPLLAWSIEQAQQCIYNKNMKIIVSTDSHEYAEIAKKYGAESPFLRPDNISSDASTDYEFIYHAVQWLKRHENYQPDIIIHLRPTQPCRNIETINECLRIFIEKYDSYDSLRSVIEVDKSPFKMYLIDGDGTDDNNNIKLKPLFREISSIKEPYNQCRQYLPKAYLHNGYIDILKPTILEQGSISGNNIYAYKMNKTDCIDIDTEDDWIKAETKL